jgi:hypothetical protein
MREWGLKAAHLLQFFGFSLTTLRNFVAVVDWD